MSTPTPTLDHAVGFAQPRATLAPAALRTVGGRVSFWRELNPARIAQNLWIRRGVLWQFTKREFSSRHRGSALGIVWALLQPLIMLGVYTFVFAVIWGAKWGPASEGAKADTLAFAFAVFAALIVWEVFSSAVAAAPTLVVSQPNFVKKVVFPLEVLPLSVTASGALYACISTGVLIAGLLIARRGVPLTALALPLALIPALLLAAGTAMIIAALGVFLRDIRMIVQGLLLQILFFLTPIFYPVERVPAWLRPALAANPMATLVDTSRRVLVFGQAPDWPALAIAWVVALVVFCVGWAFFAKSKRGFADVL